MTNLSASRNKLLVNPKFLSANASSNDAWDNLDADLSNKESTSVQVENAVKQARMTGKLSLPNAGLSSLPSLPAAMFDIRNELLQKYGAEVDEEEDEYGRMKVHEKAWECHGEETLTLVDLSDNDLSILPSDCHKNKNDTEEPWSENTSCKSSKPSLGILDKRIACFKSLTALRIKRCYLIDLPWDIIRENMSSLVTLDASGNNFEKVPLKTLPPTLSFLDLSDNHISNLICNTTGAVEMRNLTRLNLQNNELVNLPSKMVTPILTYLDLSKNKIETIPNVFIQSCVNTLNEVNLAENQLTLSMNFTLHSELHTIELHSNKLTKVPPINENLIRLGLNSNLISTIEGLYPSLQECDEHGKSKDGEFWFRSNLKVLYLQKNRLRHSLHGSTLCVMTKLSFLDVSHNDLESLPYYCGYLADLKKIALDGNPFRMIRNAIVYDSSGVVDMDRLIESLKKKGSPPPGPGYNGQGEGSACVGCGDGEAVSQKVIEAKGLVRKATQGERILNLSSRGHVKNLVWPEIIEALGIERVGEDGKKSTSGRSVATLDISNGKLTSIGKEWIDALPLLENLDVRRNFLESLPDTLSQLALKNLYCMKNCLTSMSLQKGICASPKVNSLAKSLLQLDLSSNNIEWVPGDMFNLTSLTILNLAHNKIKELKWGTDKTTGVERGWKHGLIALEHIDLSNNGITDLGYLPVALSGCKHLQTLLLNNNNIYNIPLELGLLTQLKTIDLNGNSQRKIGIRVLTKSCKDILIHLKDRMEPSAIAKALEQHEEIKYALEYSNYRNGREFSQKVQEEGVETQSTQEAREDEARNRSNYTVTKGENQEEEVETQSTQEIREDEAINLSNYTGTKVENQEEEVETKSTQETRQDETPNRSKYSISQGERRESSAIEPMKVNTQETRQDETTHQSKNTISQGETEESAAIEPTKVTQQYQRVGYSAPSIDINKLKKDIEGISDQLSNQSITKARRFSLKKELYISRSKLNKEEKRIKAEGT